MYNILYICLGFFVFGRSFDYGFVSLFVWLFVLIFSGDGRFFSVPAIQCHLARLYRLTAESSKLVVVNLPLHYNNYYVEKKSTC